MKKLIAASLLLGVCLCCSCTSDVGAETSADTPSDTPDTQAVQADKDTETIEETSAYAPVTSAGTEETEETTAESDAFTTAAESSTEPAQPRSFCVSYTGNPTTCYTWLCEVLSGGAYICVEVEEKDLTVYTGDINAPGNAKFSYTFTVTGLEAGDAAVKFSYMQSWNKDSAAETHIYKLTVDAEQNVTAVEISEY